MCNEKLLNVARVRFTGLGIIMWVELLLVTLRVFSPGTVCGDIDGCFDNLSGSHLLIQVNCRASACRWYKCLWMLTSLVNN